MSIFISCAEATKQIIRKEEEPLSSSEARKLKVHLFLCKYCKSFARQSEMINRALKSEGPALKLDPEFKKMLNNPHSTG
jgi:hypothetical protein